MKSGDIEENPGVLDQCYSNDNFVTNAVLGVRNSNVLLETRLREFNRIAVVVGGGGDCLFFVLCHIYCMEILTTIIYLFNIKTWNILYKNPRVFYSQKNIAKHFPRMIQKQLSTPLQVLVVNKPLSDCIAPPKTILPFPFLRPNQLPNEKANDNKPNNFHKINTKSLQITHGEQIAKKDTYSK